MKKLTYLLVTLIVMLEVGSCAKETRIGGSEPDDAKVYLRLTAPAGFNPPSSRSLTFNEENTIDDIYVLVFNSAGVLSTIKQGAVESSTPGSEIDGYSGHGEFSVTLEASRNSMDTYKLVILANAAALLGESIGTDDTSASIGDSYADVAADIYGTITGKMYAAAADDVIPMWGEIDNLVVQPGNSNQNVDMTRAVARIDLGVGVITMNNDEWTWNGKDTAGKNIPFVLEHVYVMRPGNTYSVIPDPAAADGAPSIPATNAPFTVAASKAAFEYAATANATGGYISKEIYVPEANVLVAAGAKPGDANHVNRMALVVGGKYNGSTTETFYRLDFAVDGDLINVLRNHLYLFSISSVSGPGFPDVETAYSSQSMNIKMNIYDWQSVDMKEIFLDGTNYVQLGRSANYEGKDRKALVYRNIGSEDVIEMETNIPLAQFKLTLSNGGALLDPEDPFVIANDRFKVELVDNGTKTLFRFTALEAYVAGAANNPSVLTVANGRIKFDITIEQAADNPRDWNNGGGVDFN